MLTDYLQNEQRSGLGRRLLSGAIAVLVIAGVVGVATDGGSSSRTATAAELVVLRQAGERAASVSTAKVEFRFDFEFSGQRVVTAMKGVVDNERQLGAFNLSFPEAPPGAVLPDGVRLVGVGNTVYVSIPENRRDRTGGKAWASTTTPAQDALAATGASPGSYLEALAALSAPGSEVERLDDDEVRGAKTTHYRVQLDLAKAAGQAADPAQLEQLKQLGADTMPMDIYLDDTGIPRKTTARIDGEAFQFEFAYELYDIGEPVDVPPPPAEQDVLATPSVQALFQLLT